MAGLIHLARRRQRLSRTWALGTAATVIGAGLLATRGSGRSSVDVVGLVFTLVAVLGYVLSVEAAQHAIKRGLDAVDAMAGMFGVGALLLSPLLAMEPLAWLATSRGAAMALHLGAVTIGVAYTLYGWGLRRLAVPTVVTLTLAEPLTAAILGTAVLGEQLGTLGWLGAALIGTGLLVAARAELPAAPRSTQGSGEAAERQEGWLDPQDIRSRSAATAPPTSEAPR
jgi:drug/metabolite transporter, DME family